MIVVLPASSQTGGLRTGTVTTLTEADCYAIAAECPSVLAVSPFIGAYALAKGGADWTLGILTGLASLNLGLVAWLRLSLRIKPDEP